MSARHRVEYSRINIVRISEVSARHFPCARA
jgi:ribosomal protein L20A (L18A)